MEKTCGKYKLHLIINISFLIFSSRNLPDVMKLLRTVRLHLECLLQCKRESGTKTDHAMCIYSICIDHPLPRTTLKETAQWNLPVFTQTTSLLQTETERPKRWTYSDPLQVCSNRNCQGLKGVTFFQCVYKKCVSEDDEEERRKRK